MAGLLQRVFGIGGIPKDIAAEIAGETALFDAESIRVSVHRSGRVPGARDAGGVSVSRGGFAITDRRVIGWSGMGKIIDVPYEAATGGPATLTLDEKGLHVHFDLDRVHPSCHGKMRIDCKQALTGEQLAAFPQRELAFPVDPQKVVRLFGSLKKLPQEESG
jgi:hypothetical protein